MPTLDYYNNFESFTNSTKDVVFTDTQDKFLSYLSDNAYILPKLFIKVKHGKKTYQIHFD